MKSSLLAVLLLPAIARADIPIMTRADLALLAQAPPPPRAPLPTLPPPPAEAHRAQAGPPAPSPPQEPPDPPDAPIIVVPNADGVLDLTNLAPPGDTDGVPNPFRVHHRPPTQFRELPLAIDSVLIGDRSADASAVINGELYTAGDRLEDLAIISIAADTIELQRGPVLLKVPVQDQPTLLRIPR